MQTLRKKTSPCKYRNDPAKFFGDGVTFKAKLIGILEVGDARGDRMCQEALQDLKMAIRAAGEHKQKIVIHVTIDGLRLRDEKTGDSLYHHPVHKISFIAQDMTDSRAFGYIFGSPDSGHRFFGIKTDKAASQVVLAMRDLFQVVFELKKKEIEFARQQFQTKTIHDTTIGFSIQHTSLDSTSTGLGGKISNVDSITGAGISCSGNVSGVGATGAILAKTASPESVTDLVDLEQELSSLQRGITQMERITPCEPNSARAASESEDPFGDSFTTFPAYNLLPPPEAGKSRQAKSKSVEEKPSSDSKPSNVPATTTTSTVSASTSISHTSKIGNDKNESKDDWLNSTHLPQIVEFNEHQPQLKSNESADSNDLRNSIENLTTSGGASATTTKFIDAFTDLDPLGTGKNKPYIDKKYFFHDLKNPPKKVLKDLSGKDVEFAANFESASISPSFVGGNNSPIGEMISSGERKPSNSHLANDSNGHEKSNDDEHHTMSGEGILDDFGSSRFGFFDDDPNWKTTGDDPFHLPPSFDRATPPVTDSAKPTGSGDTLRGSFKSDKIHSGSLQVNLPPETWNTANGRKLESQISADGGISGGSSTARSRPNVFKQNTVDVISSISTKKMKPHLFTQRFAKRDSNSINMRRLQESDSLSETETAPEPPPRHEVTPSIEPPPLPPKKQFSEIVIRPSPKLTDSSSTSTTNRYDFMNSTKSLNENGPPLPLPSRKIGKNCDGPERPVKKFADPSVDEYMTPISGKSGDMPVILPPPQQRSGLTKRQSRKSDTSAPSPPPSTITSKSTPPPVGRKLEPIIPDITLSQLLTLGVDDLASKLNVPTSKLNTMTLVELTTYLSNFIEDSKKEKENVFKVSFDEDGTDQTFVAKFDESFGDETFVANFDQFDIQEQTAASKSTEAIGDQNLEDKYAVFREFIDQEKSLTNTDNDSFETPVGSLVMTEADISTMDEEARRSVESNPPPITIPKIDTKITEVVSQAKDRYAALRDIILLDDDLMSGSGISVDKIPINLLSGSGISLDETPKDNASPIQLDDENVRRPQHDRQHDDEDDSEMDSSPEIMCVISPSPLDGAESESFKNDDVDDSPPHNKPPPPPSSVTDIISPLDEKTASINSLNVTTNISGIQTTLTKDDAEIDVYMQKALSNLSLDSREYLSPIAQNNKSPASMITTTLQNASTSPIRNQNNASPSLFELSKKMASPSSPHQQTILGTMTANVVHSISAATSPIPLALQQKSPQAKSPVRFVTSPSTNVDVSASGPTKNLRSPRATTGVEIGAIESSPEDSNTELPAKEQINDNNNESWAVFDKMEPPPPASQSVGVHPHKQATYKSRTHNRDDESPYSSDGKDEWKSALEYSRRWPNGQTSSSSRDLSPWDEDGPEYRRRYPSDEKGHGMRYVRRANSTNVDYQYDDKIPRRRERRIKGMRSRSRENFESENWHHMNDPNWSPPETDDLDDRRMMDGGVGPPLGPYEMYSLPYDKRSDHKSMMYDRRDHKAYDKRKYGRDRDYLPPPSRLPYDMRSDYDPYSQEAKERRAYYEEKYERRRDTRPPDYPDEVFDRDFDRGSRDSCATGSYTKRDYFYDRGGVDKRSFDRESIDSYESAGGRGRRSFGSDELYNSLDNRGEFRGDDKKKTYRKNLRSRPSDEYEQDSEGEIKKFAPGETRSLQRPSSGIRPSKSSGSSPWDCEELSLPPGYTKSWKGPGPETDRKMAEKKRNLNSKFSGSDGEKDMRFVKKTRGGEDLDDPRCNYASLRYARRPRPDDMDFGAPPLQMPPARRPVDPYYGPSENDNDIHPESKEHYEMKREQFLKSFGKGEEPQRSGGGIGMSLDKGFRKQSPRSYNFARDKQFATFDDATTSVSRPRKNAKHVRMEFEFDEFESDTMTPDKTMDKFGDDRSFDCDINSPMQPPPSGSSLKSCQFSNETLDKDKPFKPTSSPLSSGKSSCKFETDFSSPGHLNQNKSKLRFDDNIKKFDPEQMFEDDFTKEDYAFEDDDKWGELPPNKNMMKHTTSRQQQQHDNMKKSESVNIFVKQVDDPFEDDDFFQSSGGGGGGDSKFKNNNLNDQKNFNGNKEMVVGDSQHSDSFQWDNNLAKYDDNM